MNKQPKISILIPFAAKNPYRRKVFKWVLKYWKKELPDAEVIVGRSDSKPFCKNEALNDAFRRSSGKVIVMMDADAYIEGTIIEKCADMILENLDNHLWFIPYRKLYRLNQETTKEVIDSDPADPLRITCPPNLDQLDDNGDKSDYGHRYGAMCMIYPREAIETLGCYDERFCVDEQTEILTKTGWKNYKNLTVADETLTLNHETGLSEWQPVQKINIFPSQKQKMLSMESKNHSSLTTPNHRWAVVRNSRHPRKDIKYQVRDFHTSETFNNEDSVPISAVCNNLPKEKTWSDSLVEILAWFWTEGHIIKLRDKTNSNSATLSQSLEVNPDKCKRIKKALTEEFGNPSEFVRQGRNTEKDVPRWYEDLSRPNEMKIHLNAEAGKILQQLAPNKIPSYEFLLSLTQEQLDLFIDVSIMADGHNQDLAQKSKECAEMFQFACILAGHATSLRERTLGEEKEVQYGYKMKNVCIRTAKNFRPFRSNPKWVDYEGIVWCPTTKNSTWLARRNGTVYFTGNSGWGGEDVSILRALDTLYGKHKTTKNCIFHLWHPFFGKAYKETNWEQTRMWENQQKTNSNGWLTIRYHRATGNPTQMRKLVDEGCNLIEHYDSLWCLFPMILDMLTSVICDENIEEVFSDTWDLIKQIIYGKKGKS